MKYIPIGVDVGESSIKIAQLKKIGDEYSIVSKKCYEIPPDAGDFSIWLRSCVKSFMKERKISWASLSFSLSYDIKNMTLKIFDMPKLSQKDLSKSIIYEIEEKSLVKNIDSVYYKWSIISKKEDGSNVILLNLFEKALIDKIKAIETPKIKISSIEPQIISIGRIVSGNTVVIDFGYKQTRLYVYKNGKPYSIHTISIGGYHITKQIGDSYGDLYELEGDEKFKQAEILKCDKGAVFSEHSEIETDETVLEIAESIKMPIQNIVKEIKQNLRALEIKDEYVSECFYYTGNASKLKYMIPYFEKELVCELKPFDFTASAQRDILEDDAYLYIPSGASTLYKEFPYLPSMNFARVVKKTSINPKQILLSLVVITVVTGVALADINSRYSNMLEEKNAAIVKQYQVIEKLDAKINETRSQIIAMQNKINLIDNIEKQKKWLSDILYEMPEITPGGVVVTTIEVSDGQVNLFGYSKNYSDIGFFVIALEQMKSVNQRQVIIKEITNELNNNHYIEEVGDLKYGFFITIGGGE